MTDTHRKNIINIMMNIELAHDELAQLPESYKRDEAYALIEKAHQAVALLLVTRK
jgi:hypothetical protein